MDLITETSLEALIYKATDARNKLIDSAAIEAFCAIVKNIPEYSYLASKLVVEKIQSLDEWEAVQALSLLESCMRRCGPLFHAEVGKFRFLNEMIKMVSPKYLGPRTSPKVKDITIKLLHSWTIVYPKETKIKEAYEMLKKQGVVPEETPKTPEVKPSPSPKTNLPVDREFENKLKKLLSSKNPEDLEAANRMIKSKVMETERRTTELEKIRNNVRLLEEMVNNSQPGAISSEDLQLMSEIHSECERLRPVVFRLAGEMQESDNLADILDLSDELTRVFEKYAKIVNPGNKLASSPTPSSALLDLNSPVDRPQTMMKPVEDLLDASLDSSSVLDLSSQTSSLDTISLLPTSNNPLPVGSDFDQLGAIFNSLSTGNTPTNIPVRIAPAPVRKSSKQKALDELDVLGESLLLQCKLDIKQQSDETKVLGKNETLDDEMMNFSAVDDVMLGLEELPPCIDSVSSGEVVSCEPPNDSIVANEIVAEPTTQVKPLTDVSVSLEKITPSDVPPVRILESSNGVSIVLHLAQDSPREDVSVYVVTTTSTGNLPLSDYLFQVVVPKRCKFKLQVPSSTSLPAHNPFLPPAAITQILLIANPFALKLQLTFMVSFTREDETVTEVGEIPELPTIRK